MPGNTRATGWMTMGHNFGASSELRKAMYTL
jgi:hypothetical protein